MLYMPLTTEQRNKLKQLLLENSTEEEKQSLKALEVSEFNSKLTELSGKMDTSDIKEMINSVGEEVRRARSSYAKFAQDLTEHYKEMQTELLRGLEKLGGTITTSYEQNKPENASGMYKDMINQLSAVNESVKNKPVPVWNWPQYAGVSVRNRNFANIDPAVDSLNIGEYDYVSMTLSAGDTTETYTFKQNGANGTIMAVVVIVYSSSTRDVLVSVTKTPIVTT